MLNIFKIDQIDQMTNTFAYMQVYSKIHYPPYGARYFFLGYNVLKAGHTYDYMNDAFRWVW